MAACNSLIRRRLRFGAAGFEPTASWTQSTRPRTQHAIKNAVFRAYAKLESQQNLPNVAKHNRKSVVKSVVEDRVTPKQRSRHRGPRYTYPTLLTLYPMRGRRARGPLVHAVFARVPFAPAEDPFHRDPAVVIADPRSWPAGEADGRVWRQKGGDPCTAEQVSPWGHIGLSPPSEAGQPWHHAQ